MNMLRLTPRLGFIVSLIFGLSVFSLLGRPAEVALDSSTLITLNASSTSPVEYPILDEVISTQTVSTSSVPAPQPKKIAIVEDSPAPILITPVATSTPIVAPVSPPPVAPSSDNAALDAAAAALRNALVNIICQAPAGSSLRSMSGSGVLIDSKGIILTNAHVAQYFLLADRGVSCVIRSGSPAIDQYEAALIYISPEWLRANPRVLSESLPNGTGEYDFALLAVVKSATAAPLPTAFPHIPLAATPSLADTPIVIASYGAQFLLASQVQSALFPTVVFGSVKGVFTFARNTIDVLALGGSAAAQEGSSGGGVSDAAGSLVGTITTSTVTGATDTRSLNAITASYIRSQYASETGKALDLLLTEPTAASVAAFVSQIPALASIITAHLP